MKRALVALTMAGFLFGGVRAAVACEGEDGKECHCKHDKAKKDAKKDEEPKKNK